MNRLHLIGGAIVALLVLTGALEPAEHVQGSAQASSNPTIGAPLAPFDVVALDGTTWRLADHLGQAVVIDFITPYCSICRAQAPLLVQAYAETADRAAFLTLDLSPRPHIADPTDREALTDWQTRHGAEWPHALDTDGTLGYHHRIIGVPTILIVDANGVLQAKHTGNGLTTDWLIDTIHTASVTE